MRISRDINKSDILELVDDIYIFSKYLDIPEADIIYCIEHGSLMTSPVRYDDGDASAGFKYNNKGKLKLRDFGGYFWGDCFDAVAYILGLNVNNKQDFRLILNHIYATINSKGDDANKVLRSNKAILKQAKQKKKLIEVQTRAWNKYDAYTWDRWLYNDPKSFDFLESRNIYPLDYYWIDSHSQPEPKYRYNPKNPAYAYFFGYDENGIANYRVYIPNNRAPYSKFVTNNSSYQGVHLLEDNLDLLIITKSYKDCTSIISYLRNCKYKVGVIAPPSENHIMAQREYDWLAGRVRGRFADSNAKAVISLYDFDRTGLKGSGHLKRAFGVKRVMFTDGKHGTEVTGNKDFTDTIPYYGRAKFHKLVNEYVDKLNII